jgi:hypothetical protein
MSNDEKNNITNSLGWLAAVIAIETLVVAIFQFFIPSAPETAAFLRLSSTRLLITGTIFLISIAFGLVSWFSFSKTKKAKVISWLFSIKKSFWIIFGWVALIFFLASGYQIIKLLGNHTSLELKIRAIPILAVIFFASIEIFIFFLVQYSNLFTRNLIIDLGFILAAEVFFNAIFIGLDRIGAFFENLFEPLINRINRTVWILLLVLTPIIFLFGTVILLTDVNVFAYYPYSADETIYWHEINAFRTINFNGGQYGTNEHPAPAEFTHFGEHGPFLTIYYGSIAKLTGWQHNSPVLFNLGLLVFALILFVWLTSPTKKELALMWLVLVTYWPIWIFLPRMLQESFHISLAVIVAGLLLFPKNSKNSIVVWIFIFIYLGVLVRPLWSTVFISISLLLIKRVSIKNLSLAITINLILIAGAFIEYNYYVAPYPNPYLQLLNLLQTSWKSAIVLLIQQFSENLKFLILASADGFVNELWRKAIFLFLIDTYLFITVLFKNDKEVEKGDIRSWISFLNIYVIGGLFISFLLLIPARNPWHIYRYISPFFLLISLLMIFSKRRQWIWVSVASSLIMVFSFSGEYKLLMNRTFSPQIRLEANISELNDVANNHMQYLPEGNRWCNTIDISKYGGPKPQNVTPVLFGIPPEFGITHILNWELFYDQPLKARYVIVYPDYLDEEYPDLIEKLELELLDETPSGNLYFNPHNACDKD